MMAYIPTSNEGVALTLSDALWGLARPPYVRSENDTCRMFGTIKMSDSSVWLAVDTTFTVMVHAEAELDGIAGILQPYIDAGQLPADTNTNLAAFIESKRGSALVVYEAIPAFFKAMEKTQEQLQTLGLWPSIA